MFFCLQIYIFNSDAKNFFAINIKKKNQGDRNVLINLFKTLKQSKTVLALRNTTLYNTVIKHSADMVSMPN